MKRINSYNELFNLLNVEDDLTVSFHHHLRNGDYVLNKTMLELDKLNIKNLTLAASGIFNAHEPIVPLIEKGTISSIYTNYLNGPVAKVVSEGKLKDKLIMQTHGGRPRSIEEGELVIDIAFIAVSAVDKSGNGNGTDGSTVLGALGYSISDVEKAKQVVLITDTVVDELSYVEIDGKYVDYVLVLDEIGDQFLIQSGTTSITRNPVSLKIARDTVSVIEETGYLKNGLSFQTGAGGTSLAVAKYLKKKMIKNNIKGSFASGGITGYLVDMLEEGLFDELYDVQCFDLDAVRSLKKNKNHHLMSASEYANPLTSPIVDKLDIMILGATEIDVNFNVNVTTASDGYIIGGSGGHSDTAAGSKLAIVVTNLVKARTPIIVDEVLTKTTPGKDIDILVTEYGIAINPLRGDLLNKLEDSELKIKTIEELRSIASNLVGKEKRLKKSNDVIGYVEYRDGNIIDKIYKV
ncbi:citrate lyase subunit alpha [Mycoplasmatota bacterium]|nr:citrate lyase subunit alpha [Mycoplasmatota bacterium]